MLIVLPLIEVNDYIVVVFKAVGKRRSGGWVLPTYLTRQVTKVNGDFIETPKGSYHIKRIIEVRKKMGSKYITILNPKFDQDLLI